MGREEGGGENGEAQEEERKKEGYTDRQTER